jgi:hypothetical protein
MCCEAVGKDRARCWRADCKIRCIVY